MEDLCCLLDTPALSISYDTANKWLYTQWQGDHNAHSVAYTAEQVFSCLVAYPCTKLLSDHSLMRGNWLPVAPSLVRRNFERLAVHGIAHVAWIPSFSYGDRIAMEEVLRYTYCPMVGLFDDVPAAHEWLQRYTSTCDS